MGKLSDFQRATDSQTFEGTPDSGLNGAGGDMATTNADRREAQNIPAGSAPVALVGGEYLAELTAADIARGNARLTPSADVDKGVLFSDEFANGDTQQGNPYDKGGFLDRPQGWSR